MKTFLSSIVIITLCLTHVQGQKGNPETKSKFRALYTAKLLQYIHWPESEQSRPFNFGVIQDTTFFNKFIESLPAFKEKIQDNIGSEIQVEMTGYPPDASNYSLIFCPASSGISQDQLLKSISAEPVFLFTEGYEKNEGMINYYLNEGGYIRYSINEELIKEKGFTLDQAVRDLSDKSPPQSEE